MTSHMTSIELLSADGMNGKFVTSGGTLPGRRRTRPNMRWSHLNGSLVSSDPGTTVFIGKLSCWLKGKKNHCCKCSTDHRSAYSFEGNNYLLQLILISVKVFFYYYYLNKIKYLPDFQNEKKNKLNYCFPRSLIKIMFINTILH